MRFEILSYGSDDSETERYQMRMSESEAKMIRQALAVICYASKVMDRNGVEVPEHQTRALAVIDHMAKCGIV